VKRHYFFYLLLNQYIKYMARHLLIVRARANITHVAVFTTPGLTESRKAFNGYQTFKRDRKGEEK
jgi:hypothetical protein